MKTNSACVIQAVEDCVNNQLNIDRKCHSLWRQCLYDLIKKRLQ